MTYLTTNVIAGNQTIISRVASCVAAEPLLDGGNPTLWAQQNILRVVVKGQWDAAWESAEQAKTINQNQDTGARTDVITDGMILSAVQGVLQEMTPTTP